MPRVKERQPSRSKSTAVRLAMLRPSRRQMNRWRREGRVRRAILAAFAGLLGVVAAILGFGYWRENVARAAEPAATVYGETITVTELLERVRPRSQALESQARFYEAQGINQAAAQLNLQRSRLPDQVLDSMVEDKLVRREAEQRGIVVSDEEVDARIRKEIAEQEALSRPTPSPTPAPDPTPTPVPGAAPTPTVIPTPVPTLTAEAFDNAYEAFLARANVSDLQYRELVRSELYKDKLKESFAATIPRTEEQVRARHILLDSEENVARARQQLAEGIPFEQVARELSTDQGSRDKGGDLGWFGREVMNPVFEQAAFTQPVGVIGEPFQAPNGTHIVQVLEGDPARPLTEEQIKQRADQAYQAWYAGLKGSSEVQTQLTPDRRAWILRHLGSRRSA